MIWYTLLLLLMNELNQVTDRDLESNVGLDLDVKLILYLQYQLQVSLMK